MTASQAAPSTTTAAPARSSSGSPDPPAAALLVTRGEGRGDGGGLDAAGAAPGSGPKWTPGPEASAGSCSTHPASITLGFSSRPPACCGRPLFRLKISVNRLPLPSVCAAIAISEVAPLPEGGTT
jgi:hypothetical protein